jgi:hypothetical protein
MEQKNVAPAFKDKSIYIFKYMCNTQLYEKENVYNKVLEIMEFHVIICYLFSFCIPK